jgi:5-methylthioadenosine/S-adenosylhomocysteine deaminase
MHLSETMGEVEDCRKSFGCNPVQHLRRLGLFSQHFIAAHCAVVSEEEIQILSEGGIGVAHNPDSNMKLGTAIFFMILTKLFFV